MKRVASDSAIALARRSPGRFVAHLALHLGLVGLAASATLSWNGPLRLASLVCLAYLLVQLFAPLHECTHRNAFESSRPNRVVAAAIGVVIVRPARMYEAFHLGHHRHTNDPERDPELIDGQIDSTRQLLLALTGFPLWRGVIGTTWRAARGSIPSYVPARLHRSVKLEARAHLIAWFAVGTAAVTVESSVVLISIWVVALVIGIPMLQIALIAEHTTCPYRGDVLTDTRTTMVLRPFRWFNWNSSLHTAHHSLPNVPYFRLGELTSAIISEIPELEQGYPSAYRTIGRRLRTRQ